MEIIRNRPSRVQYLPIDGNGSDIREGAVIMPGVTDDQDRSVFIKATSAAADAFGLLATLHDFSVVADSKPEDGLAYVLQPVVPFLPGCEVAAEMADDADNDVDVASATSTVITVTSSEDDIDGGWIFVRAGTGEGQLGYLTASAAGTMTIKSAFTTDLTSSSKLIIMRPVAWQLVELDSNADKIKSTAAAGALKWRVLENQIRYPGELWTRLDPTKHHNLQFGTSHPKLRQILVPADTFHNPLD